MFTLGLAVVYLLPIIQKTQQSELLVGSIQSQLRLEIKSGWEQMSAFFQE